MRARWLVTLMIVGGVIGTAFAQPILQTNCDPKDKALDVRMRVGPGPFRLAAAHCQYPLTVASGPFVPTTISPDISSIALINGAGHRMAVARLSSAVADGTFPHDAGLLADAPWFSYRARAAMRWSADSKVLWSATQPHVRPRGGWALGPMRAVRVENGEAHELPELRHEAGPLEALLFAPDGRALALFGARGNSYQPPIPNPNPSLAFVDTVSGRVIESLPLKEIATIRNDNQLRGLEVRAAEVAVIGDGRLRAFFSLFTPAPERGVAYRTAWVVWTEGERPKVLSDPYPVPDEIATAISSNGTRLLIVRRNHRVDTICRRTRAAGQGQDCTTGPPVDGILAAMHDLETGEALWSHRLRLTVPGGANPYPIPELSDDGRYALIGLPSEDPVDFAIALISTRDGSVLQRFPVERGAVPAVGFAGGSKRMWINLNAITSVYALR